MMRVKHGSSKLLLVSGSTIRRQTFILVQLKLEDRIVITKKSAFERMYRGLTPTICCKPITARRPYNSPARARVAYLRSIACLKASGYVTGWSLGTSIG